MISRLWYKKAAIVAAVVVLLGPLSVPALAQESLRGVALVIGESDYDQLPKLPNPRSDARAVGEVLSRLGFDVTTVTDTDQSKLERSIDRFLADAEDADVALVYYSGHGVEIGGENYLIPVDADISTPKLAGASLRSVGDLVDRMQRAAPIAIVLLDACRTNPFSAGQLIELPGKAEPLPVSSTGLAVMRGPTPVAAKSGGPVSLGTVLGFAAEPGRPALDGKPGENSPYAKALLKHVAAGNYSFSDVMTLVTEEVFLGTDGQQLPWTNSALRRVLSFGQPTEEAGNDDEAMILRGRRELLMTVSSTPPEIRNAVTSIAQLEEVPLAPMFGLFKAVGIDIDDPEELSARLQAGAEEIKARLAELSAITTPDPEVKRLLELGRKAQSEGAIEEALAFSLRASARTAELSRNLNVLAADIDRRRSENAETFAEAADAAKLAWQFGTAAEQYGLAADELDKSSSADPKVIFKYRTRQANALTALGNYKGDNAALAEAIKVYRIMLAGIPRESMPSDWAMTQFNLGIALRTLGERETGTVRLKEAVAAQRQALEIRTRERNPVEWAASQNSLGIALRSLSSRTGDSEQMTEAAAAYRRALEVQTPELAPGSWANTQNNLAGLLLSLGERQRDESLLQEAIATYRLALKVRTRDRDALQWAETQHNIGIAYKLMANLDGSAEKLEQAIATYRLALEERTRERVPLKWASTQYVLGNALRALGENTGNRTRLEEAVVAYRLSLEERTRERIAPSWATTQNDLGIALHDLGRGDGDTSRLNEAVAAFQLALEVRTRKRVPFDWAVTQSNLGSVLTTLGEREHDGARLEEALAAYRGVIEIRTRERDPLRWATAQNSVADLLRTLGEWEDGTDHLNEAVGAYGLALEIWTVERDPVQRGGALLNMAKTLGTIGERTGDAASMKAGREAVIEAKAAYAAGGVEQAATFAEMIAVFDTALAQIQ